MTLIRKLKILCENNNTLYSNKNHLQQQEENKRVGVGSQYNIKRCGTGMKCSHQDMRRNQMT